MFTSRRQIWVSCLMAFSSTITSPVSSIKTVIILQVVRKPQLATCLAQLNSVRQKNYFRGDEISVFYHFKTTLKDAEKSYQNRIKLEVKNLKKYFFLFLFFSFQFVFYIFCFRFFFFFASSALAVSSSNFFSSFFLSSFQLISLL